MVDGGGPRLRSLYIGGARAGMPPFGPAVAVIGPRARHVTAASIPPSSSLPTSGPPFPPPPHPSGSRTHTMHMRKGRFAPRVRATVPGTEKGKWAGNPVAVDETDKMPFQIVVFKKNEPGSVSFQNFPFVKQSCRTLNVYTDVKHYQPFFSLPLQHRERSPTITARHFYSTLLIALDSFAYEQTQNTTPFPNALKRTTFESCTMYIEIVIGVMAGHRQRLKLQTMRRPRPSHPRERPFKNPSPPRVARSPARRQHNVL